MSRTTFDAGCERLEELRILAENILSDIGPSAQGAGEVAHLKMGNQYQPMHEMRLKAWWFQWVRHRQQKQKATNGQGKKLSAVMEVAAFTNIKRAQGSAKSVVCMWGTIQQHAR
jgi:hypothetical protein